VRVAIRRRWRWLIAVVLLAAGLVALAHPGAEAKYQGSSVYDNIAPETDGYRGLAERYPLNRYGLDFHVDAGVDTKAGIVPVDVDVDGIPALVLHAIAAAVWDFTRFLVNGVITLFMFAFSLDLVGGGSDGRPGALTPVAAATRAIYDVLGQDWLPAAIALAGAMAAWQVFIRREIVRTAGQAFVSVVAVPLAILIVTQPQLAVGGLSRASHQFALGALSMSNEGVAHGETTKQQAEDQLFRALIYDPWVVLNFGGIEHCVDRENRPVKPSSPACHTRIDNRKKYAERWLKAGPANDEARKDEYDGIREGKLPSDRINARYTLSDADKPAVDIQQQAMAGERLGYAVLIFLGELGAVLLLGALAIGVILGQVIALLLFAFAPIVLLAALFPGAGHAAFRTWIERLCLALARPAIYGLVLGVVLAVSSALLDASATLGWLLAFGFQCIFYWAVFLYRHEIQDAVARALPGPSGMGRSDLGSRARETYYKTKLARPVVGFAAAAGGSIAGTALAGAHRANQAARHGLAAAGEVANHYAAEGHATGMISHATRSAEAIASLEADHRSDRARAQAERVRREDIAGLERRDDGGTPIEGSLSSEDQARLAALREQAMDEATYVQLRERVDQVEQRRQDGKAPFSQEEVNARAVELAARQDESEASAPSAGARDSARDTELERRLRATLRLEEAARSYRDETYQTLFPTDDDPTRAPGDRRRWLWPVARKRRPGGER
jgi:hypothetical protein